MKNNGRFFCWHFFRKRYTICFRTVFGRCEIVASPACDECLKRHPDYWKWSNKKERMLNLERRKERIERSAMSERNDIINLAKAMGMPRSVNIKTLETRFRRPGGRDLPFEPFTDANDEREVLRYMCRQMFSVRTRFFRQLDLTVQSHVALADHVAWPAAMIFMKDGDIARAALHVLCQPEPASDD